MKDKIISVITINLNNFVGLEKTVKSVTSQSYKNIEYIIIDGGSTDGSISVLNNFRDKISYLVSEPDRGIYNAMNKGIEKATGDYLLFLNSGDWLIDDCMIENVVKTGLDEDLIYGDLLFFDNEKEWPWYLPDNLTFEHFYNNTIPHPSTFIRKRLFDKVGLYDENLRIVSDWKFFTLALAKYNCTYKHIPLIVTAYNFDGISSNSENLALINKERSTVLCEEFPLLVEDYHNLKDLKLQAKKISYFLKTRWFIKKMLNQR